MSDTMLKNVQVCQPEQRNIYNKIFGGFVMRQAFELAWINASLFSKGHVEIIAVDDITFKRPVLIGSIFFLSSLVVHTQENQLLVKVHGETLDRETNRHHTTNEFYFKFIAKDKADMPKIIPKTYSDAMTYVQGRRHWQSIK
jgi:acyl-coenzyme A thioesterase 9